MAFKLPSKPGEIRQLVLDNLALSAAINDIERLAVSEGINIHSILDRHGIKYKVAERFAFGGKNERGD